jgi:predicted nucleic acid-binding protein
MGEDQLVSDRLLLDTNILIDFLRRHAHAIAFVDSLAARPALSVITVSEPFAGVREGRERSEMERFFARSILLDVDQQIAARAGLLLRTYRKSHGVGLADALIAAMAEADGARLATLNIKHFPMLPDVLVPHTKA